MSSPTSYGPLAALCIMMTLVPVCVFWGSMHVSLHPRQPVQHPPKGAEPVPTLTVPTAEGIDLHMAAKMSEVAEKVAERVATSAARKYLEGNLREAVQGYVTAYLTQPDQGRGASRHERGPAPLLTASAVPNRLGPSRSAFIVLGKPIAGEERTRVVRLLKHFIEYLGSRWDVQIYYTPLSQHFVQTMVREVEAPNVFLDDLGHDLPTRRHYTALLKNISFWRRMRGEKVLTFQTDTVLCRGAPMRPEDFFDWDYIGAPWSGPHLKVRVLYRKGLMGG